MKKLLMSASSVILSASVLFAQETAAATNKVSGESVWFFVGIVLVSVIGLSIAAGLCGLAQGNATSRAVEGIARQPEANDKIFSTLIIGLAFIESLAIYVLVLSLILIFANPLLKYITG
jgi:F-type H+-transporting ATPase subunit c